MARLRNRIVKADYWGDGDLLRMPRDMRETYRGLWAVAEDSGCLEDDPFTWKLLLWPGPYDTDISVELIEGWRDLLIAQSKLIPYEVGGRRYFFIEPFHRHEHPRNPQSPDLPLPPWVQWDVTAVQRSDGRANHVNSYVVDWPALTAYTASGCPQIGPTVSEPKRNGVGTESSVLSCPVLSGPVLSKAAGFARPREEAAAAVDNLNGEVLDNLMRLAGEVACRTGTWEPNTDDRNTFELLAKRFPVQQIRTELAKFRTKAIRQEIADFGDFFTGWMNKLTPDVVPAEAYRPRSTVSTEAIHTPTPAERAASAEILRHTRQSLARAKGAPVKQETPAKEAQPASTPAARDDFADIDFGDDEPPETPETGGYPPPQRSPGPPAEKHAPSRVGA